MATIGVRRTEVRKFDMIRGRAGLEGRYRIDKYGHLRISLNGSDHLVDWIANFWFIFKRRLSNRIFDGSVHRIWYIFAEWLVAHLEDELKDSLTSDTEVYITGHSMGGAVAEIVGMLLYRDLQIRSTITTYGAPSPWSWFGVRKIGKLIDKGYVTVYRYTHRCDPVPYLPGRLLGYNAHRGKRIRVGKITWPWKAHLWLPKDWRGL